MQVGSTVQIHPIGYTSIRNLKDKIGFVEQAYDGCSTVALPEQTVLVNNNELRRLK